MPISAVVADTPYYVLATKGLIDLVAATDAMVKARNVQAVKRGCSYRGENDESNESVGHSRGGKGMTRRC
jgi:hypothetical protein